ncbi:MAG: DUF4147 domain-containing protein, partial [Chloroflexota bacterium]|nr:DUF4147 domain-containing protein [Chloroflexota bacterium]
RAFPASAVCREAAHPVLDQRAIDATGELLEWVNAIPADAHVVVLLSGGGSALLERPVNGVSLDEFQTLTRELLRAGADIHELNSVRSRVSLVKGGGLRAAIPSDRVVTLALSDVLGNDPSVIASGPTVPITQHAAQALSVLDRLNVRDRIPASILQALEESVRPEIINYPDDRFVIVADNSLAVQAAADHLRDAGYDVEIRDQIPTGEAREIAASWVQSLPETDHRRPKAILAGGELTVTVRGEGLGGRNTEFAFAAARELDDRDITGWTVASLATDGQDAMTGAAGAIVDSTSAVTMRKQGLDLAAALDENDTCPPLDQIGATVRTGPTGTNVNDLYFAVQV